MKTPIQYKNQLADLVVDQIKTDGVTPDEAKKSLDRLAEIHARIRDLDVSLNLDIHALRSQYQGRIAALSINPHGKPRIEEEQRVEEERDHKLAPYDAVRIQLHELMTAVDEKRALLEKIKS